MIDHKFPWCPLQCDLYADDFGTLAPYPGDIVYNWNPVTVQFWSEDKFLHGTKYDLVIQCRVDQRAFPNTAENVFSVTIFDECYNTQITPLPSEENYQVPLYFFHEEEFRQAGQTKTSCEAPQYQLDLISTDAEMPAIFFINQFTKMIEVDPQMEEEVGRYTFVIKACVQVQFVDQICVSSAVFNVDITHSCLATKIVQIVAQPIYTVMSSA